MSLHVQKSRNERKPVCWREVKECQRGYSMNVSGSKFMAEGVGRGQTLEPQRLCWGGRGTDGYDPMHIFKRSLWSSLVVQWVKHPVFHCSSLGHCSGTGSVPDLATYTCLGRHDQNKKNSPAAGWRKDWRREAVVWRLLQSPNGTWQWSRQRRWLQARESGVASRTQQ